MRPRLRRAIAATAVVAAATLTVTGYTSTSSTSKATAASKPSGAITLWVGSWWSPKVPAIMTAWHKAHPEITLTINPTPINGYLDKFTASALGGSPPDIVDLDVSWISSTANQHLLQPLTDLAKTADVKDYAPGPWKASQYKGVQYGMPDRSSSIAVFYNKTLFDKAGLAYPRNDWTYSDMLTDARKLTVRGSYGIGYAADLSDPQNAMDLLSSSIWGHGGDFLNKDQTKAVINSPQAVAGIAYWAELYSKYHVAPPGTPGFSTTRDVVPLFEANQVAIFPEGSNKLATLDALPKVKYGTVLMPGNHANPSGGYSMAVPVGAKNPAAAKVFIQWFQQPKNMATLMNRTPARLSSLAMAPWNAPEFDVFTQALKYGRATPSVGTWVQMQTDIITDAQKILVGQATPKQAADTMQSQMTALLAQKR